MGPGLLHWGDHSGMHPGPNDREVRYLWQWHRAAPSRAL